MSKQHKRSNDRFPPLADMSPRLQNHGVTRTYVLIVGAVPALHACSASSPAQLSLCEVAANRPSYAGKTLTVEGSLLASKHGSAVVDLTCDKGIPIKWESDEPQLRELTAVGERSLAEPMTVTIRVTGKMKRAPRSAMLNEPYWYLALNGAQVLKAEPTNEIE